MAVIENDPSEDALDPAGKVRALNPLVRRAIGYKTDDLLPVSGESEVPDCPECGGIGLRPSAADLMVGCKACRSDQLQVMVLRPSGYADWVACRALPGAWGRGCSPVEALLDMERTVEEPLSMFGRRFLLQDKLVPLKCYLREEEMDWILERCRESGSSLPNFIRSRLLNDPAAPQRPGASEVAAGLA